MKSTLKQRFAAAGTTLSVVGIVLSPAMVAATSDSGSSTITANVNEVITLSGVDAVTFTITPDTDGNVSSNSDSVNVATNSNTGYTLSLKDTAGANTLVNADNDTFTAAASQGALANGTWGYAVAGNDGFDGSYSALASENSSAVFSAVPASDGTAAVLKTTAAKGLTSSTTVWYGAKANTTQAAGSYTGNVTYTATVN